MIATAGCAGLASDPSGGALRHGFPAPSGAENYCAWYAEAADGVLYFGEAPFWSAMRAAGDDPMADLRSEGPQPIGRFDLAAERHLEPLDVSVPGARSGVWDVLPHPNGRVYFTTFYETAGYVEPATGASRRFPGLGRGLNELALGEAGNIVVSRYGGFGGDDLASGSLVVFDPDGALVLEAPLSAPPGLALAPKTVAWDSRARRYWIVTDLVWRDSSRPAPPSMHPALVLDEAGREIARIDEVEVHFVRFASPSRGADEADASGEASAVSATSERGVAVAEAGGELRLIELDGRSPAEQLRAGRGRLLDANFPASLDFVQDVAFGPAGEVIVTRWSGLVHVVGRGPGAGISTTRLPRDGEGGLYYAAAFSENGRVCATLCHDRAAQSDIDVVCAPLAPAEATGDASDAATRHR